MPGRRLLVELRSGAPRDARRARPGRSRPPDPRGAWHQQPRSPLPPRIVTTSAQRSAVAGTTSMAARDADRLPRRPGAPSGPLVSLSRGRAVAISAQRPGDAAPRSSIGPEARPRQFEPDYAPPELSAGVRPRLMYPLRAASAGVDRRSSGPRRSRSRWPIQLRRGCTGVASLDGIERALVERRPAASACECARAGGVASARRRTSAGRPPSRARRGGEAVVEDRERQVDLVRGGHERRDDPDDVARTCPAERTISCRSSASGDGPAWSASGFGTRPSPSPGFTNSRATISPRPRTSPIDAMLGRSSRRPARSWAPRSRALATRSSSSMTSSVALAAAQATTLPPYVPPWVPGRRGVEELPAGEDPRQRQARRDALGDDEDVRLDVPMADREQLAGPPEAGLDLVGDRAGSRARG